MTAKALSIQQPWAWAITDLDKRVENRKKPFSYRGEVFLHASAKARPIEDLIETLDQWPGEATRAMHAWMNREMPLGAIVGVAQIYECVELGGRILRKDFAGCRVRPNRWLEGPCALMLSDVVKLPTPVPCKGALGIWKVPASVEAEVRRQLAMAKTETVTDLGEMKDRLDGKPNAETAPAPADPTANSPEDLGYTAEEWKDFTPDQRRALRRVFGEIEETKLVLGEKRLVQEEAEEAAKEAKEDVKVVREKLTDLREQAEDIAAGRSRGELPGMDNASALGVSTEATATVTCVDCAESLPQKGGGYKCCEACQKVVCDQCYRCHDNRLLCVGCASKAAKPTDVCECGHPKSAHEGDGSCLDDGCAQKEDDGCLEFVLRKAVPAKDAPPVGAVDTKPPTEVIPADLHTKALDHVASAQRKGKGIDANGLSMALFGNRKKEFKPRCEQILARLVADGDIVADENSEEGKPKYLPAGKE